MRYANNLSPDEKKEVRDFYFGSDDVDFQRGELEWGNHNIYFDQYSWSLKWDEIRLPSVKE
jgi:hypothetical protein